MKNVGLKRNLVLIAPGEKRLTSTFRIYKHKATKNAEFTFSLVLLSSAILDKHIKRSNDGKCSICENTYPT